LQENRDTLKKLNKTSDKGTEVYLTERGIQKRYEDAVKARHSYNVQLSLTDKGLSAKPFSFDGKNIIMEYLPGKTLYEEFLTSDNDSAVCLAVSLYKYSYSLYESGFVQQDCNFTNYIVCGDRLTGVDYDEMATPCSEYDIEDSLSDMILFAATYRGVDDDVRKSFIKRLIKCGNIKENDLVNARKRLIDRRGKDITEEVFDRLIKDTK